ncbi:MAG: MFS transporter [Mycolicibacterium sp.]|uniref:MFS transporter n=1 Tax=Mycolicibacterium sp. TaxID=2320850 RepID=UPI003D109E85
MSSVTSPDLQQRPRQSAIVVWASVAAVMTAPGQTAAVSVFTDPLIASLGISRTELSTGYLIGTLLGAAAMPWVGRALDRYGVRPMMIGVGLTFGAVLIGIGFATSIFTLTVGFVGIRMCGQGALGLVATTLVAVHTTNRRGLMLGITAGVGSAGVSMAPLILEQLVSQYGIQTVWIIEGLAVWCVVVPIGIVALRRLPRPTASLEIPLATGNLTVAASPKQWTAREASRTAMFWAIAAGLATSGMVTTGLNFHQIALLGERGLSATEAAANFIPQTAAALVATLVIGASADFVAPKVGIAIAMVALSGAMVTALVVTPGVTALGYGLILGLSGGAIRAIEAAAYAHYFGIAHIGAIRGIAATIGVGSTAFGPLAVALGNDNFGSYGATLLILAPLPLAVAAFALFAPAPRTA